MSFPERRTWKSIVMVSFMKRVAVYAAYVLFRQGNALHRIE
jgi:hypothetical protein